ncbi:MAG: DNA-binding protein [Anaerolineae bacterium]|jgi:predicted flap endonuclease-1-like 5' DNA nuclease|nr:DNA-binding protein [Anaerolineae bacterium]
MTPSEWPKGLSQPAQRALQAAGLITLAQIAEYTEAEIATLHGIGPKSVNQLRVALTERGLSFREHRK